MAGLNQNKRLAIVIAAERCRKGEADNQRHQSERGSLHPGHCCQAPVISRAMLCAQTPKAKGSGAKECCAQQPENPLAHALEYVDMHDVPPSRYVLCPSTIRTATQQHHAKINRD
jgi:hypothetical protein